MAERLRVRQVVEMVFGLAPATLFLFPFLLVGALGMVLAEIAGGAIDWALAGQIFWALAGAAGIVALWVVVINDGGAGLRPGTRIALTVGLLLGITSAVRWLSLTSTSGHKYDAKTWAVWIVLLAGPLVVGSLRVVQLWKPPQDGAG
jgi:hypothetical protein